MALVVLVCAGCATARSFPARDVAFDVRSAAKHCTWALSDAAEGVIDAALSGVAAPAQNDAWSVGYRGDRAKTLIERWDGSQWSIVAGVDPGSVRNALFAVAASSASDVWSVGVFSSSHFKQGQPLIERWDGSAWDVMSSPAIAGSGGELDAVVSISADDVWAAGYQGSAGRRRTLIEHWNGTAWAIVPSPNQSGAAESYISTLSGSSEADVYAAGASDTGPGDFNVLVEHWNGKAWSLVAMPSIHAAQSYIGGLAARSATEMFAVGGKRRGTAGSPLQTLGEFYNGSGWSAQRTPNSGAAQSLIKAASVTPSGVVAVGSYFPMSSAQTFAMFWNGTAWSITTTPYLGPSDNTFNAAAAIPQTTEVWAVGTLYERPLSVPLIERCGASGTVHGRAKRA